MKVYRFGSSTALCYDIIIFEDDGSIKVATVGLKNVIEKEARPMHLKSGITRLIYGGGSSLPYKNEDGKLNDKYILIYEKKLEE